MDDIKTYLFITMSVVVVIFALMMFELLDSKFSPAEVVDVCKYNGGVEQVVPRYGGSREAALVICKDGGVGWVR